MAVAVALAATALGVAAEREAWAQAGGAPLPTLPPPVDQPSSGPSPPAAAPPASPPPPAGTPARSDAETSGLPAPPPAVVYVEPPPGSEGLSIEHERPRAPRDALWVGARLGVLAYGGGLYVNDPNAGTEETTGNFIEPGPAIELNVGARLARHYIPYVTYEIGLGGAGRRFDGTDTRVSTSFAGIGIRYVAGDVDTVAFVSELSFGFRSFHASNDTGSWSLTGFEPFRVGLGAEIRLTRRFTISPLITIADGVLTDTSGNIAFGPHQGDGLTGPPFVGNGNVPDLATANYYAVVFGCGAHFDLLGE